ncbi:MAG: glycosyltransferase family 2 protein [Candidatus Hinthialibacter sp.]
MNSNHLTSNSAEGAQAGSSPQDFLDLSLVIPVKDERETLRPLYEKICEVMESLGRKFEILFIDDGSVDGSFDVMRELFEQDKRVRVFRFHINYGKSPALAAGFEHARGRVVVTIDADLQDDPAEIPRLLEKLDEGYDLISGWKKNRQDPFSKRLFSWIFNAVVSRASGIHLHDFNCGLKCYRREVLEQVRVYGEMHRFLPVMAKWYGFKIGEVVVTHHPRKSGRSKYGGERIIKGILDFGTVMFFTYYVQSPAHLFGRIGIAIGLVSFILFFISIITMIYGWMNMGGIEMAISLAAAVISFQCICLGLMSELLTFFHRREEPSYFINERLEP